MRGTQYIIDKFRHFKASKRLVASAFVVAVALAGVGVYQFNQTAADAASPCNAQTNNIVPSGTHSYADVTRNYNANTCGDLKAIYNHYWIKPNLAAGDKVYDGTSKNDGTVVANGRVVAKNAASIGRHNIHSTSQRIAINGQTYYQTSHVGGKAFANPNGSLPTLVVLDKDGNFKYAIVKACGNPIYATPNNPPKPPKPPVKDIQVCELSSKKIITIKEDQFNPQLHSKNLKDCEEKTIQVCELATKKVITIKESEFNPEKHSKNLEDCKEVPAEYKCTALAVSKLSDNKFKFEAGYKITGGEFKSVTYTVKKDGQTIDTVTGTPNVAEYTQATPGKYTVEATVTFTVKGQDVTATGENCKKEFEVPTPPADKIVVCDLESKKIITIDEDQFDSSKHSKNLKDCEEEKCPIPGKEHLPKDSKDCYENCPIPGKEHLPKTSAECEEPVVPETPAELPKTGAGDLLSAGVGLSAMGVAAYYYAASRRIL